MRPASHRARLQRCLQLSTITWSLIHMKRSTRREHWSKVTMVRTAPISQISSNTSDFMEPSVNPRWTPFAPILRYHGRRQELNGLLRSLISNVVDVRDPIQVAYDQLAQRAEVMLV